MKPSEFPPQHQDEQPGKEHEMNPRPEYIRESYKGCGKLKGKTALITGGDSGIGRAVAVHFAREGANVAIAHFEENEAKDARETRKLIEAENARCLMLAGDLRSEDFCREIVEKTVAEFGSINILVNNAAVQFEVDDFSKIDDAQMRLTFETNIYSYMRCAKYALGHMKKGDVIINTTSVTAYDGHETLIDYASTKGAIVAFTRSLAAQMTPKKGIRVNGIAPGPVWTPLIPASFDEEKVAKFGQDTPMGRAGQPSELGPAYVFLASEDSSYITGQIIHINGGRPVSG